MKEELRSVRLIGFVLSVGGSKKGQNGHTGISFHLWCLISVCEVLM